jgi:hypothetical protein
VETNQGNLADTQAYNPVCSGFCAVSMRWHFALWRLWLVQTKQLWEMVSTDMHFVSIPDIGGTTCAAQAFWGGGMIDTCGTKSPKASAVPGPS